MSSTIDITETVEYMRSSFVLTAQRYIMGLLFTLPGVGPIAGTLLKILMKPFLGWILDRLSTWAVMEAFFANTIMRKANQAIEYTDAIKFKKSLPPETSNDEYEKAELEEINKFNNLVLLTN